MTTYDVYALGNALVDTEIEVTDDDLASLNIEKGLMTLVDQPRQRELESYLLAHGHTTAIKRACGGSAANSVISLSHFGGSGYLACTVADDELGNFYLDDLNAAHVGHPKGNFAEGETGRCLVLITPDAERSMNTYLGVSANFDASAIDETAIRASKYLYIEGYLATSPPAVAAVTKAREVAVAAGVKIAVSLSDPGIVEHFGQQIAAMAGEQIDLICCNQLEAMAWTKRPSVEEACEVLAEHHSQFYVTCGSKGALVHDGFRLRQIAGHSVTAVDTNGAGDMFAGAYLYGLTAGWEPERAARLASLASAAVVAKFGPRLHAAEYHGLIEAFEGNR